MLEHICALKSKDVYRMLNTHSEEAFCKKTLGKAKYNWK